MRSNPWKNINEEAPPKDTRIWGYDHYYEGIYICGYDGGLNDYGEPYLWIWDNPDDDDHYFKYWKKASIPRPPKDVD